MENACTKIGIMGGTFNPIHNGHLILADTAFRTLALDKVLFIPSGNSYMKENVLETKKRVEMVRIAIEKYPQFALSLIEADRQGNSYTSETLECLTKENPNACYFLIMGADSLFQIETWFQPEKIFLLAKIVCTVRDNYDMDKIRKKGQQLRKLGADIIYLDMPKIELSSTDIRAKVKKQLSILEDVPAEVAAYIQREQLYCEK
ncbi:MAG: nicotinate (nicotinamide) nucleotide adenylyltransferase [Lachnospiraceae bacterium]|nr:nicotinate (nicotinamide) nucleotide adenylyltransferase [Lachnospiraceae bacterium]